jgi:phosphoglucosamine mutase
VKLSQKLFGTSGIRGIVNQDLTLQLAVETGLAVGTATNAGKITIAHDTRTTATTIENAVVSGLLAAGARVIKLGLIPTPVLAYATRKLKANAGVMITASHNPPQYNGIKLFNSNAIAYTEKQEAKIEQLIRKKQLSRQPYEKIGTTITADIASHYVEALTRASLLRKWRVILDPGNGATCRIAPMIFEALGCKVSTINAQPDGYFPARSPEPDMESVLDLCKTVRQLGADVGFAYDGDGDRMVAVNEEGEFAPLDQTLAAYAAHVARSKKGGTVITTVEASMCVEEMVQRYGGSVLRTKVGDVAVALEIKKRKAVFGGEPCGAWINPQFHYCPDGVLSSILLLEALESERKTLSEFVAGASNYPFMKKSIGCPNERKTEVMLKITNALPSIFPRAAELTDIDGIRLSLSDSWLLIRASGTEPLIRVKVEARTTQEAEKTMKKCISLVHKAIKETVP